MARVSYIDEGDLPDEQARLLRSQLSRLDLAEEYRDLMSDDNNRNSYRVMAHLPSALRSFRNLVKNIKSELNLSPIQLERLVLATARELRSRYEWHNHVRIALNEGLEPDEIRAISRGERDDFDEADAAMLDYAIAFVNGEIDDDLHNRLETHFDERTVVGVGMLAGRYMMLAHLLEALEVETEEPFVGWNLEKVDGGGS